MKCNIITVTINTWAGRKTCHKLQNQGRRPGRLYYEHLFFYPGYVSEDGGLWNPNLSLEELMDVHRKINLFLELD